MCVRVCARARVYFTVSLTCRSEMYVKEVRTGLCDGKAIPVIVKETPATAYVNGNNGIGTVRIPPPVYCASKIEYDATLAYRNCIYVEKY